MVHVQIQEEKEKKEKDAHTSLSGSIEHSHGPILDGIEYFKLLIFSIHACRRACLFINVMRRAVFSFM